MEIEKEPAEGPSSRLNILCLTLYYVFWMYGYPRVYGVEIKHIKLENEKLATLTMIISLFIQTAVESKRSW